MFLLLVIVAIISTIAFYKRSIAIGARTGQFASIPFIALGILLGTAFMVELLLSWVAQAAEVSAVVSFGVLLLLNVFVLLAYLTVIRAFWVALNRG